MNGEVSVLVDRRENVLSVPNDAIRTTREAAATARMIGLDPDSVTASVQEQSRNLGGGMGGGMGGGRSGRGGRGGNNGGRRAAPQQSGGEVVLASPSAEDVQGGQGRGGRQGGMQLPEVTDQDCAKVTTAMAKKPQAQTLIQGLRGRVQAGEIDQQQSRAISDSIYKSLGVESNVARACQFRNRASAQGGAQTPSGGRGAAPTQQPAAGGPGAPVQAGEFPMRGQRSRAALVYVRKDSGGYSPRVIRAGMSDLDFTEVTAGLQEGEQVVLMSALAMQASRDSALARMRGRSGGGVPGMQRNTTGGTNVGGGGGGRGRG